MQQHITAVSLKSLCQNKWYVIHVWHHVTSIHDVITLWNNL